MKLRLVIGALLALATHAHAQWLVTNLTPAGAASSDVWAVNGTQQAGIAGVGAVNRASLWNGTAGSWTDLTPAGATASEAHDVNSGQQAGVSTTAGGANHASLWTGSAGSWVDLNPVGSSDSQAFGVQGPQQVGYAFVGSVFRASLWTGTAASWVDLSPSGAPESFAYGVSAGTPNAYESPAEVGFKSTHDAAVPVQRLAR